MGTPGRKYCRYSRKKILEVLDHHERCPSLSFRRLALMHGIACPETVRYWLRTYRVKEGLTRRRKR